MDTKCAAIARMGSLAKDHNFALEQVALKRSYQIIPYPLLSGEVVYILLYLGAYKTSAWEPAAIEKKAYVRLEEPE